MHHQMRRPAIGEICAPNGLSDAIDRTAPSLKAVGYRSGTAWRTCVAVVTLTKSGTIGNEKRDILTRGLDQDVKKGSCRVITGVLADPYTAKTISFVRGEGTSALLQIDHVVSLSNAWRTGAQQITQAQRISLANDSVNLFAVDGRSNARKGAGDTATWLPPNKSFR